jgi:uncharacterized membrane protein YphA (DoxX/SURF4 family)
LNGFGILANSTLHLLTEAPGAGVAAWFLAAIFLWSGTSKLRRPALAAMSMVHFGVIRRFRPWLGSVLGAAEVFLALMLATGVLPWLSFPITAALLWFFVLLIARSIWSGAQFACACFGEADGQISLLSLARTIGLAAVASLLALIASPLDVYTTLDMRTLQAVAAVSLLALLVLASYVPRLLQWNKKPLGAPPVSLTGGEQ